MEASDQLHAPTALAPEKKSCTRLGGSQTRYGRFFFVKRKVSCVCRDSNPGPSSPQQVAIPIALSRILGSINKFIFYKCSLFLRTLFILCQAQRTCYFLNPTISLTLSMKRFEASFEFEKCPFESRPVHRLS